VNTLGSVMMKAMRLPAKKTHSVAGIGLVENKTGKALLVGTTPSGLASICDDRHGKLATRHLAYGTPFTVVGERAGR